MSVSATRSVSPPPAFDSIVPTLPSENAATATTSGESRLHMFGADDDSPSFWDLLDVINPLQHIPVVNTIYREESGDQIGVGARLVGGALFGGVLGLVGAVANCLIEESTGKDAGGHVLALFRDDSPESSADTRLAAADPAPAPSEESPARKSAAAAPDLGDLIGTTPAATPTPATDAAPAPTVAPASTASTADSSAPEATKRRPAASPLYGGADTHAAAAAAAAAGSEAPGRPLRLGHAGRDMPVPARTIPLATQSPPAVGVAVTTGASRSNVPITGYRPAQAVASAATARTMVEAQGQAAAPASARLDTTAPAAPAADWFLEAMSKGLDKYERGSGRGAAPSTDTIQ